ncbi:MAG: hypothetical protein JW715_16130 [Sedimentisphaerales bacterium]|nr:hypothetical protein [Sedimentisphaerales bacterium]
MTETKTQNNDKFEPIENNSILPKKRRIFASILKWFSLCILTILFLLALVVDAPPKIFILLLIFLAAFTALPKPARKWFWLGVGVAFVILIIWIFLPEDNTGWRPYTFDEEIAAFRSKYAIPDEENAALAYYEIYDNYNPDANSPDFFKGSYLSSLTSLDKPWLAKDHPEMIVWLNGYQDLLQKLIQNSQRQKCRFLIMPYDADSDQKFTEALPKIRYSVFLLISAANNDIAEGRTNSALEKYSCVFRIADHLHQQPAFVPVMVNWAIKRKTLEALNHFIIEQNPDIDQLKQIANLLNDLENNWGTDWHNMLDFDRLKAKNYFAGSAFEVNKAGKIRLSRQPFFEDKLSQNALDNKYQTGVFGKIRATLRWLYIPSSPKKIAGIVEAVFEEQHAMAESDFDWDKVDDFHFNWKLNNQSIIRTLLYNNESNYKQIHEKYCEYLTLCRGSRLLIAIKQYKDEHGSWPPDLESIKTSAPAEAFLDPVTGKQLQYENHVESFSLYGKLINIWPQ